MKTPFGKPSPSFVSIGSATSPVIATGAGTVVLTLPAIKGGDAPKAIDASISIIAGAATEDIIFTIERDGTPFGESYPITIAAGAGVISNISCTWLDDTPGKGKPVYVIRAVAATGGSSSLFGRRATAHNV